MVGETAELGVIGLCGGFRISDCDVRGGRCRPRPGVDVVYSDRTDDPSPGETDFVPPEPDLLCGAITDVGLCLFDGKSELHVRARRRGDQGGKTTNLQRWNARSRVRRQRVGEVVGCRARRV